MLDWQWVIVLFIVLSAALALLRRDIDCFDSKPVHLVMDVRVPVEPKGIRFDRCVEEGGPIRQKSFEGNLRYMSERGAVSHSVACSGSAQLGVEWTRIPAQSFEHSHRFGKGKIDR